MCNEYSMHRVYTALHTHTHTIYRSTTTREYNSIRTRIPFISLKIIAVTYILFSSYPIAVKLIITFLCSRHSYNIALLYYFYICRVCVCVCAPTCSNITHIIAMFLAFLRSSLITRNYRMLPTLMVMMVAKGISGTKRSFPL